MFILYSKLMKSVEKIVAALAVFNTI